MTASEASRPALEVGLASTETQRREVLRLRFRVYVEELGLRPSEADYESQLIGDDWDETGDLLYVAAGDQIVGTLRSNVCSQVEVPSFLRQALKLDVFLDEFSADRLSFSSKFVIARPWRSSQAAALLITEAYRLAKSKGILFDFSHCALALISLYERVGYRRYADNFVHEDVGLQVPMVVIVDDLEHFRRCKSPIWRLTRGATNDPCPARWFADTFPQWTDFIAPQTLPRATFCRLLDQIFQRPLGEVAPLFTGLDRGEIQRFLRLATVHRVGAGETVLRQGDAGHEMFVVLSGTMELIATADGCERSLQVLEPGEVFGEIALFKRAHRTTRVVALTDCQLLVLSLEMIENAMVSVPEIAAKVMFNLGAVLCKRVQDRTAMLFEPRASGESASRRVSRAGRVQHGATRDSDIA